MEGTTGSKVRASNSSRGEIFHTPSDWSLCPQWTPRGKNATIYRSFLSINCCACYGWYLHQSSGAHITVSTLSGINEIVTNTSHNCESHSRQVAFLGVFAKLWTAPVSVIMSCLFFPVSTSVRIQQLGYQWMDFC